MTLVDADTYQARHRLNAALEELGSELTAAPLDESSRDQLLRAVAHAVVVLGRFVLATTPQR